MVKKTVGAQSRIVRSIIALYLDQGFNAARNFINRVILII
jgi:dsRNA-specific ribonuclease